MSNKKIVQAWKSEEFRSNLSAAEQAMIPENPAGFIDLSCDELVAVNGSAGPTVTSIPCLLDDLKYTKDGGTFCGTRDIACPDQKRSDLGLAVRG